MRWPAAIEESVKTGVMKPCMIQFNYQIWVDTGQYKLADNAEANLTMMGCKQIHIPILHTQGLRGMFMLRQYAPTVDDTNGRNLVHYRSYRSTH